MVYCLNVFFPTVEYEEIEIYDSRILYPLFDNFLKVLIVKGFNIINI